MEHIDRRVKRTQQLLAKALIALTFEKSYEAVTIREITERADVGYATFFRHYVDKDALLHDVVEVVLSDLLELLQHESSADSLAQGLLIFRYVHEHSALCRLLVGSGGSLTLLNRIRNVGAERALERNKIFEEAAIPAPIAANHVVAASIALIQWWLEHDMTYPPERMAAIYDALIVAPTQALLSQPDLDAPAGP